MYAKIYRSLWEGSMRGQGIDQLVLVYLCAHADANGIADVIHDRIAADIGFSEQQVRASILRLEAEDPRSRSPDARGARLARLDEHRDWGWLIVNYDKYRTANDLEKIKEQNRRRAKEYRERLSGMRHAASRDVTLRHGASRDNHARHAESRQAVSSKQKQEAEAQQTLPSALPSVARGRRIERKALENGEALPDGEITADQAFDEIFWPEYPRKRDKEDARKAWKALKLKDTDEEKIMEIMVALRRDVKGEWRDREQDKIPYGATWLNRRGWLDG